MLPGLCLIKLYAAYRNSGSEIISITLVSLSLVLGKLSIRSFSQLETGTFERSFFFESGSTEPFVRFRAVEEYSLFELSSFVKLLRGLRLRLLSDLNRPVA
jgi:hypothetical protein